jgi:hypothetical protein
VENAPVIITKNAPERRRRAVTTLCGCTCCTCCCCLHTLGSLIGAAVAPTITRGAPMPITYYYDEETGDALPEISKPGLSAVSLFWWISCFLIFCSFLYTILLEKGRVDSMMVTGVILLLVFPLLQLASAVVTLIVFGFWPRPDRGYQLKQLGKITAGVLLGSILGIGAMVGIAVVLGAIH